MALSKAPKTDPEKSIKFKPGHSRIQGKNPTFVTCPEFSAFHEKTLPNRCHGPDLQGTLCLQQKPEN